MSLVNNNHGKVIGSVNTLSGAAKYQADPLAVFKHLCHDKQHNLLLESAEIDKKHQLKSLLLTDAAVRIVCNDQTVRFEPLSLNGNAAIEFATQQLADHAKLTVDNGVLIAEFPQVLAQLDEHSRLMAINPFHGLRLFNQLKNLDHHDFAIFLGGAFAFDMISMSEELPDVEESENTCPDYVYYLAETLVIIDHEKRSSEIIGNVFTGPEQQKCYFEISRRLSAIKSTLENFQVNPVKLNSTKSTVAVTTDVSDEDFCQTVNELKEHIRAGDIFQVVPSRTFSLPCKDSFNAYQALKASNPSPYMFYLQDSDFCMFGASPESAIKYQESNRQVEI